MSTQGWGPPPQRPPDQPQSKRHTGRNILLAIVGVIIVLAIIGSLSGGESTDTTQPASTAASSPDTKASKSAAEADPAIGDRARDGKFEFIVNRVRCGVRSVGGQYLNKTAQGQYCLISVRVRNIGNEQRTFEQSSQYLYDSAGSKYETDEAGLYLDDSKSFLEEINPGNGVNGTLVYDVPKSFKPAKIELHDSAFSGGVTVSL
jgi:hypothetical protein